MNKYFNTQVWNRTLLKEVKQGNLQPIAVFRYVCKNHLDGVSRHDRIFIGEQLILPLARDLRTITLKDRISILSYYSQFPRFRFSTINGIRGLIRSIDADVQSVDESDINNLVQAYVNLDEAGEEIYMGLLHTLRKGVFDTTQRKEDSVGGGFLCEFLYKNSLFSREARMSRAQHDFYAKSITEKLAAKTLPPSQKVLEELVPVIENGGIMTPNTRLDLANTLLLRIIEDGRNYKPLLAYRTFKLFYSLREQLGK